MAERGISLESIMQHGGGRRNSDRAAQKTPDAGDALRSVILITHATSEYLVREALEAIYADGVIDAPAQVIRIERE
jgi:homoserine dehydrogenase